MKKEKKKIIYRDIECDSDEEKYFLMWAFELKEAGYISKIERAPSFKLTDGWVNEYEEQLKTKTKVKTQTILQDSEYTPDILLTFEDHDERLAWQRPYYKKEKYSELFVGTNSTEVYRALNGKYDSNTRNFHPQALIEVKSEYNMQNMVRVFGLNQKFLYHRYGIYVNLVKIPKFFEQTFCPKEFLVTPKTGQKRKLSFVPKTIEEFLENL